VPDMDSAGRGSSVHTSDTYGHVATTVAGFRDPGHNPFTREYAGIHPRQLWHITCLTLPRASWSFLTMSMGSDPA